MGMTYWLNLRDGERIDSEESDLSATCRATESLDRLCRELGVSGISDFIDGTEVAREFDEELEFSEDDQAVYDDGRRPYPLAQMRWCDAARGLETFRKLQARLAGGAPVAGIGGDELDDLQQEFDEIIGILDAAAAAGRQFHLELLS